MIDTKETTFAILRNDSILDIMQQMEGDILTQMRDRKHKAKDLKVSHRVLSHWRDLNLIDVYGDNPDQTSLCYVELFWLHILVELRSFGLSMEKIQQVKKGLFSNKSYPLLEAYIYLAYAEKQEDFFLLVSSGGLADIGSRREIEISEALGILQESHIRINLRVVRNRFHKKKIEVIRNKVRQKNLSKTEESLLNDIRTGNYKEIILSLEGGVTTSIKKTTIEQNPNPLEQVRNFIASQDDFSDLEIKKANGRVVVMRKTVHAKV